MTATIVYEGNLRCVATHLQSGTAIETDAPTDNRGKGERFSPTDLVCTALGTCMITTMAMKATDMGIELKDTGISVKKHMLSDPRRIGQIDIVVNFPSSLDLAENDKTILQRVGDHCPVIKSLHPDIVLNIEYHW
ncbi:OsmC family protein [Ferruginibacter lapsinanis]|uniref:OsmC family protein n=1 Tax=Ferruginibacter lapsinanis TaxID=563172 RepID=UPI001E4B6BA2|nr:OsmC family protein [Ferruginibacter lapsinanis]UEG49312.1 OsmC family protein [Ferruginibacter lapsinanis]